MRTQRFSETYQILRANPNDAAAWAVNVRDEKEPDRQNKWENQKQDAFRLDGSRTIAEQHVAADGDRCHQGPGRPWDSVPPGSLRVSL